MKHRLWFFFFAISLVTHAVIFFSNIKKGRSEVRPAPIGIDIQIKARKKQDTKNEIEETQQNMAKKEINHVDKKQDFQQEVLTAKTFDNQILEFKAPVYPRSARRIGATGRVVVELSIDTNGLVTNVKLLEAASFDAFNEVVLASAKHWRFRPQKVPTILSKVINFSFE